MDRAMPKDVHVPEGFLRRTQLSTDGPRKGEEHEDARGHWRATRRRLGPTDDA